MPPERRPATIPASCPVTPKSVVFPASSTLPELVVAAFGQNHPALTFKLYVLVSAAAVPWLVGLACVIWRIPRSGTAIVILLDLLYIWTDWPINYVGFGMLPYFLAIPLALVATGAFARFLTRGGAIAWLMTATLMSLAFLVHLTVAMVVVPAALLAYVAALRRPVRLSADVFSASGSRTRRTDASPTRRWCWWTHIAVFLIPIVVLAVNAFWWLPGIWLASTKGESGFVFAHLEGASGRLLNIVAGREARIEVILMALGIPGLGLLACRDRPKAWPCWDSASPGYSGATWPRTSARLDFLQPGRHTYAFYSGLALAGGAALEELFRRLRVVSKGVDQFDRWVMAGTITERALDVRLPVVRFDLLTICGRESRFCRAVRRNACTGLSIRCAVMWHQASACSTRRGEWTFPGSSIRSRADGSAACSRTWCRGRGHRRSLLACIVEDQLHPVR